MADIAGAYRRSWLTETSGTSAPGVTINTDWWLPRVETVMFDVRAPEATACTWLPPPEISPEMLPPTLRDDSCHEPEIEPPW
jgi:hypothetical protein